MICSICEKKYIEKISKLEKENSRIMRNFDLSRKAYARFINKLKIQLAEKDKEILELKEFFAGLTGIGIDILSKIFVNDDNK